MTLITVWLDPQNFHLYNISQNINRLKGIHQILFTLLGPLFKEPAPSAWYQKKGPVILYISYSTTVQKFLTVFEISLQVNFMNRICNSLKGSHRNKMKEWKMNIIQDFILNYSCSIMLCKIFVFFEILEVKNMKYWPLKSLITQRMTLNTV